MARILAPADLRWLIPFPRYGRLKLELVLEQILGSVEGPQLRTDLQGAKQQWGIFLGCKAVSANCVLPFFGCMSVCQSDENYVIVCPVGAGPCAGRLGATGAI